jgi:hypothetical protein
MKNYPKYFATKKDFENIIHDFPQWEGRVLKELEALNATKDDVVTRAVALIDPKDPESDWITEKIPNPLPIRSQKGFGMKAELIKVITEAKKRKGELIRK